jgi:hypothetical protein
MASAKKSSSGEKSLFPVGSRVHHTLTGNFGTVVEPEGLQHEEMYRTVKWDDKGGSWPSLVQYLEVEEADPGGRAEYVEEDF